MAAGASGGGAADGEGPTDLVAVSPRPRPSSVAGGVGKGGGGAAAGGGVGAAGAAGSAASGAAAGSISGRAVGHSGISAIASDASGPPAAADTITRVASANEGGRLPGGRPRTSPLFPKSGSDDVLLGRGGKRLRPGISPIQAVRPAVKHLVTTLSLSPRLADGGDTMTAGAADGAAGGAAPSRSAVANNVAVASGINTESVGERYTTFQSAGAPGVGAPGAASIAAVLAGLLKPPSSRPPASVPGSPVPKQLMNLPGTTPQDAQVGRPVEKEEDDQPSHVRRRSTAPITRRSTSPIIGVQVDDDGNRLPGCNSHERLLGANRNLSGNADTVAGISSSLLPSQPSSSSDQARRCEEASFHFPPGQLLTKALPCFAGPSSGGDDVSLSRRARASDGTVAPRSRKEASSPAAAAAASRGGAKSDKKRGDGIETGGGGGAGDGGKADLSLSPSQQLPLSSHKSLPHEGGGLDGPGGWGGEEGGRGRERRGKRRRKAEAVSSSSEGEEAEGGRGEGEEWEHEDGPREDLDDLIK